MNLTTLQNRTSLTMCKRKAFAIGKKNFYKYIYCTYRVKHCNRHMTLLNTSRQHINNNQRTTMETQAAGGEHSTYSLRS